MSLEIYMRLHAGCTCVCVHIACMHALRPGLDELLCLQLHDGSLGGDAKLSEASGVSYLLLLCHMYCSVRDVFHGCFVVFVGWVWEI
jgi:hypothetical protein